MQYLLVQVQVVQKEATACCQSIRSSQPVSILSCSGENGPLYLGSHRSTRRVDMLPYLMVLWIFFVTLSQIKLIILTRPPPRLSRNNYVIDSTILWNYTDLWKASSCEHKCQDNSINIINCNKRQLASQNVAQVFIEDTHEEYCDTNLSLGACDSRSSTDARENPLCYLCRRNPDANIYFYFDNWRSFLVGQEVWHLRHWRTQTSHGLYGR